MILTLFVSRYPIAPFMLLFFLAVRADQCEQWKMINTGTVDEGVCSDLTLYKTCQGLFSIISPSFNPTPAQIMSDLKRLHQVVPPIRNRITSAQRFNNYFLYRFLMFSAASYCTEVDTVSKTIPPLYKQSGGRPLVIHNLPLLQSFATFDRDGQWVVRFSETTSLLYAIMLDTKSSSSSSSSIGEIILSFRGTATIKNIATDMDGTVISPGEEIPESMKRYWLGTAKDSKVFRGFYRDLQVDQKFIQRLITDVRVLKNICSKCNFVVTGHSMGGTLALLASIILKREGLAPDFVYTYSATMPGNSAFNKWLVSELGADKVVRVVSRNDIVPWFRVKPGFEWPSELDEANMNSRTGPGLELCKGGCNSPLKDRGQCSKKTWDDHLSFGGLMISPSSFCSILDLSKNTQVKED